MADSIAARVSLAGIPPPTNPRPAAPAGTMTFHELLSELNPLQYIPVVGAIYRAVTGDTIPVAARTAGSFVVSGLMGGPIGVATNVVALVVENVTGFDPEKIEQNVLASIGIGARPAPTIQFAAAATPAVAAAKRAAPEAWSAAQLTAYGVSISSEGTLKRGNTEGSDVLNDLEIARHEPQTGSHSYAANTQRPGAKS